MRMRKKIKVVFMGTPQFAADILRNLIEENSIKIVAVYTMPDAVRGRGNKLVASPVKQLASNYNIPVETPFNFKDEDTVSKLKSYKPDFICVAAYGILLPESVLNIPKYECLNVHGSLLPRWRGSAPIQRAILEGDPCTGTSIMRMEKGMDTGDFCLQSSLDILDKNVEQIEECLALAGSKDLILAINSIVNEDVIWVKQQNDKVTIAAKISKKELNFKHTDSADCAERKVRASGDAHPSKCCICGRNVRITQADLAYIDKTNTTGKVLIENKKLYLGMKDEYIEVLELKPDGKKLMTAKDFIAGIQNKASESLIWTTID